MLRLDTIQADSFHDRWVLKLGDVTSWQSFTEPRTVTVNKSNQILHLLWRMKTFH